MKNIKISKGKLYISHCPSAEELTKSKKFSIIWNLASETSFLYDLENIFADKVFLAKISDYDIPTNEQLFFSQLKEVSLCLMNNGKVLVHCLAGHGRTGMTLACIKMVVDNLDAQSAIRFALSKCKGPEKEIQMLFIANNKEKISKLL